MKRTMLAVVVMVGVSMAVGWAMRRHRKPADPPQGQFDYYVLALSWAPNYCAGHPNDHSRECTIGQQANFVLHGLWPQANEGSSPIRCAPAPPVSHAIVRHMLEYYPSRGLVQHEWRQHGVCSGVPASEYFDQVEQALNSVKIPDQYRNLQRSDHLKVRDVEQSFAEANHAPPEAFHISCHAGEMVTVEACLTKDLHYQACTPSVRECRSPQVLMRQVQ
jgi:ribonuclease T2